MNPSHHYQFHFNMPIWCRDVEEFQQFFQDPCHAEYTAVRICDMLAQTKSSVLSIHDGLRRLTHSWSTGHIGTLIAGMSRQLSPFMQSLLVASLARAWSAKRTGKLIYHLSLSENDASTVTASGYFEQVAMQCNCEQLAWTFESFATHYWRSPSPRFTDCQLAKLTASMCTRACRGWLVDPFVVTIARSVRQCWGASRGNAFLCQLINCICDVLLSEGMCTPDSRDDKHALLLAIFSEGWDRPSVADLCDVHMRSWDKERQEKLRNTLQRYLDS